MPGIFGAVACNSTLYRVLEHEFGSPWERWESVTLSKGILGGHAFGSGKVLRKTNGINFAVDGEASIYDSDQSLFVLTSDNLIISPECKGNIALIDTNAGLCYLATEWAGSFPLYYCRHPEGGLLFCSRVRPLAHIIKSPPDLIAIREFLHELYMLCGRSFYKNIHRLMPGQVLKYDVFSDRLQISEASRAWVGLESLRRKNAASIAWDALMGAVRCSFDSHQRNALMMSGGWDSRTLLAAMRTHLSSNKILAYSHGDLVSREIRLASRICHSSGIPFHSEPIDDAIFDLDLLKQGFDRVETAIFPEWTRAGNLLSNFGVRCVSAGVYGEVLGGHYGMVPDGVVRALLAHLFGLNRNGSVDISELLHLQRLVSPWYVKKSFWDQDPKDSINADIEQTLARLRGRGIYTNDQLLEAFITEHRGSQYINSQTLSCRAFVDISLPFADRALLVLASRIPLKTKIHNSINREMFRQRAGDLLRFSTASTLLPTRAPIVLQEASRLLRRVTEDSLWRIHFATFGKVNAPRFGSWYWEFLRNGNMLRILLDDLRSVHWDKDAISRRIEQVTGDAFRLESASPVATLTQCLFKIYTVDLMLR